MKLDFGASMVRLRVAEIEEVEAAELAAKREKLPKTDYVRLKGKGVFSLSYWRGKRSARQMEVL